MTSHRRRAGALLLETIIALGVLTTAAIVVAQTATWSLHEWARTEDRLAAMEAAANLLESARGRPWADLTPEWGTAQKTADDLAERLPDAVLLVRVAAEADRPHVKRVTVDVKWTDRNGKEAPPVTLVGLFADRSAGGAE